MIELDLIIPTYRRPRLLLALLESIERLDPVRDARLTVHVADNNSGDETPAVVREFAHSATRPVVYHLVTRQGRSAAINGAIAECTSPLLAFIDDDEELWPGWLTAVNEVWQAHRPDFMGGPCVPRSATPFPRWMPDDWPAIVGDIRGPDEPTPYREIPGAMFMGGNAVIRRELFTRLGGYHPALGRSGSERLMSCEDRDLDARLCDIDAVGYWVPGMTVWHDVPSSRLTQEYFRRWASDHGASLTFYSRIRNERKPRSVAGVELWRWRQTLNAVPLALNPFGDPARRFSYELFVRESLGMLRGRFMQLPRYETESVGL